MLGIAAGGALELDVDFDHLLPGRYAFPHEYQDAGLFDDWRS
jgi:hypothetical protein